ncbi:hypothetical protein WJX84_008886 [Apatococcus fuscideae]|uniref:Generative cell specific-1/HAP2 domain-containing protein n=1 Tax=Apatococcus fuscideae TaxID=2026836 RepID=A0AAW1STT9_9CHLO
MWAKQTGCGYTLFCLLSLQWQFVKATVIANSQLETCVADGSTVDATLSCSKKLVTTMTLTNGASLATEQLQYSVPCIGSTNGKCPCSCNYATDPTCTCRDLAQTINVTLTKTPVYAVYPLTYVQSFNSKPYEAVILTGGSHTLTSCSDGAASNSPTCGWATNYLAARITDSQGFCCSCTLSQVGSSTFGSSTTTTRANLDCDFLHTWFYPEASAHCLRWNTLWYEGYSLGESQLQFNITITVQTSTSVSSTNQTLVLSPSTPLVASTDGVIIGQLLGDLAGYTSLPVLSSSTLMIPHPAGQSVQNALTTNLSAWMVIPNTMINAGGTVCNVIGTNYNAFRYQSSACSQVVGSCLNNQIYDLAVADQVRVAAGTTPLYLVSRYGGGLPGATQAFKKVASGPLWFGLPITQTLNSLVTLSVKADNLTYVVNSSPGSILAGRVCAFANATCGSFVAITQTGYLQVSVQNAGYIASSYTLEALCSTSVLAVPAQQVSLASKAISLLVFAISSTTDLTDATSCNATLLNSQGAVVDSLQVDFTLNATVYDAAPTESDISGKVTGVGNTTATSTTCTTTCPNIFNVTCLIKHLCWNRLGKLAIIVLGIVAGVMVVAVGFVQGWWISLLKCCWSSITVCGNLGRASVSAAGKATAKAAATATAKADAYAQQDLQKTSKRRAAEHLNSDTEEDHSPGRPIKAARESFAAAAISKVGKAAERGLRALLGSGPSSSSFQLLPAASSAAAQYEGLYSGDWRLSTAPYLPHGRQDGIYSNSDFQLVQTLSKVEQAAPPQQPPQPMQAMIRNWEMRASGDPPVQPAAAALSSDYSDVQCGPRTAWYHAFQQEKDKLTYQSFHDQIWRHFSMQ